MKGDREDDPTLFIQAVDELGRPVSEELLGAARRNWKRIAAYAQKQGQDEAVAAEALEATVHSLSSVNARHPRFNDKIKNLEQYVFVVAVHRLSRLTSKEASVEYVGSLDDVDSLRGPVDWVSQLEDAIALKEAVGYLDKTTRQLFMLRRSGYSWEEIGIIFDASSLNVRSLFSHGLARARRRILDIEGKSPTPEKGRAK